MKQNNNIMSSNVPSENPCLSAIEAGRKHKTNIILFLLGFLMGGVIISIITYSVTTSTECENLSPGNG